MSTKHYMSSGAVFTLTDTGATSRDLSADLTSVDGLPGEREMQDSTALGDTGRKHIPGLDNVTITLEGFFDDTAATGTDVVLGALRAWTVPTAFTFCPVGIGATSRMYSGTCLVSNYTTTPKVGELIPFKATLLVDGSVTIGVHG